jgi:hypothetical protein
MEGFTVDTFALAHSFQSGNRMLAPPMVAELVASSDPSPSGPPSDRSATPSRPPPLKIPASIGAASKHVIERRFSYGKLLYGAESPVVSGLHSLLLRCFGYL